MRRLDTGFFLRGLVSGWLVLSLAGATYAQDYRMTDLGELGFVPNLDVHGTLGLNNLGEVVYGFRVGDEVHPLLWLPEANYELGPGTYDLSVLFGTATPSIARDLSVHGQVVGQTGGVEAGSGEAVIWNLETDEVRFLGFLPDGSWSRGFAITDSEPAVVVGESEHLTICPDDCEDQNQAPDQLFLSSFRTTLSEGAPELVQLASVDCDTSSVARDVGGGPGGARVAGFSDTIAIEAGCFPFTPSCPVTGRSAVVWDAPLSPISLPGLDAPQNFTDSEARGVNDFGETVGWGYVPHDGDCLERAFYWATPGSLFNLGGHMPPGQAGDESRAEAINNLDDPEVVGWNARLQRALLWENPGGSTWTATDLNDAIPACSSDVELRQAHDVNDNGWIAAWGQVDPGTGIERHAYVLTPVGDEPADLDGDGTVGIVDFLQLLASWGPCQPGVICWADINLDCTVSVQDFLMLLSHWTVVSSPSGPVVRSTRSSSAL